MMLRFGVHILIKKMTVVLQRSRQAAPVSVIHVHVITSHLKTYSITTILGILILCFRLFTVWYQITPSIIFSHMQQSIVNGMTGYLVHALLHVELVRGPIHEPNVSTKEMEELAVASTRGLRNVKLRSVQVCESFYAVSQYLTLKFQIGSEIYIHI